MSSASAHGETTPGHGLLTQVLHYALTAVLIRGIQVLMTPIITRLLPPSEYGYSVVFQQSVNIVSSVAILGMSASLSQVYLKRPEEFRDTVKSVFSFVLVLNLLTLLPLLWVTQRVNQFFSLPALLLVLSLPIGVLLGWFNLFHATLIAAKRSVEANRLTIVNFTGAGVLFILLLLMGERTWLARAESYAVIVVLLFVVALRGFLPHLRHGRFRRDLLVYALRFGIPTIFAWISYTLFTYADRMLLVRYRGAEEMGLYSFACVIGLLPLLISGAALSAFTPHLYELLRQERTATIKRHVIRMAAAVAVMCVAVTLAARPLALLFAGSTYHGALPAVPILALYSFASYATGYATSHLLFHEGTRFLSASWMLATIINIALNLVFIPRHGYIGAAWSTLIAGVLQTLIVMAWIRWRYGARRTGNGLNLAVLLLGMVGLVVWAISSSPT